jgi:hypothetical protein
LCEYNGSASQIDQGSFSSMSSWNHPGSLFLENAVPESYPTVAPPGNHPAGLVPASDLSVAMEPGTAYLLLTAPSAWPMVLPADKIALAAHGVRANDVCILTFAFQKGR